MKPQGLYASLTANFPFYAILLFCISIPFPFNTDKIALLVLAVLAIEKAIRNRPQIRPELKHLLILVPPIAFVSMLLLGMLYTSDLSLGWRKIETSLPILAIPFIGYAFRDQLATRRNIEIILISFVVSNFISIVYAFAALTLSTHTEFSISSAFSVYTRDNLASQLAIHPIYIALTTATSFQVLSYLLVVHGRRYSIVTNLFYTFNFIVSFLFILLLGAKMALIAVIVTSLLWISVYIITNKKVILGMVLTFSLIVSVVGSIVFIPNINKRFVEIQNTPLEPPRGLAHNSTNLRIGQLLCSIEVIEANSLLGVGTGDYEKALNTCYKERQYSSVLYIDSYNAHNQYLQTWIMIGLVGMSILLLMLLTPIYSSIIYKDWLILAVFITFILCFLTESCLQTSKGVILFTLFYLIFILRFYSQSMLGSNNKSRLFKN